MAEETDRHNYLHYGDNLEVLYRLPSDCYALIYLDPPFNSARNYNVIFNRDGLQQSEAGAQIQAFEDTWAWTHSTEQQFTEYVNGGLPNRVGEALSAFRVLVGENDALAYLVNMAPRLVEMHRVLKDDGTLWLHCDPTMSHYLKILLDAIFDPRTFHNEVIWKRTGSKGYQSRRLANNHDVLLVYGKSQDVKWNQYVAYIARDHDNLDAKTLSKYSNFESDGRRYQLDNLTGPNEPRPNLTYEFLGVTRRWRWTRERMQKAYEEGLVVQTAPGRVPRFKRYLEDSKGIPMDDVWSDIHPLNSQAQERLGYPTQKPLKLLERIIALTTDEGDRVLDPFCGCGTTVDAAQKLNRLWTGIDITYIAVDLIEKRLRHTYGDSIVDTYTISGIPRDAQGAQALFDANPFDFERWAVSQVGAQPNDKQVGDRGVDGVARFILDGSSTGKIVVSVKGGKQLNPAMVRDLQGTVEAQKAEMGVLITQHEPTRGMLDVVNHAGTYTHPANGHKFPRLQILTTTDIFAGKKADIPLTLLPYVAAQRTSRASSSTKLF
jgi:site-specific DNA-methyltransferase (adenine-specific)